MAEPPQMDRPTPMSVEISEGMRSTYQQNAVMSAVAMVEPMMGSDIMRLPRQLCDSTGLARRQLQHSCS